MFHYKKLIAGIKAIFKPAIAAIPAPVRAPFSQSQPVLDGQAVRIPRDQHDLSRRQISKSALRVLYGLHEAGYEAYLVGGGVRDVLLQHMPKDFDIVTDARPEQIKRVFRNCRLIGRRFLLAHVYFGSDYIEVATFRAPHGEDSANISHDGRVLRDNVYGTRDEDALRRDFTINALYYDISDFSVLDYANGMQDLHDGIIRLIGEPVQRYQEDPVRMLRAVRIAAKLDFSIESATAEPLHELGHLLDGIPPARLFEEVLKLFLAGHATQSFEKLCEYGLFSHLFPAIDSCFDNEKHLQLVQQALHNTDKRFQQSQSVMPAFLFAALLWPPLKEYTAVHQSKGLSEQDSIVAATQQLLSQQTPRVAIPRRLTAIMQEIWLLQPRLTRSRINRRQRSSLLAHDLFRAAYDFLLLRASIYDDKSLTDMVDFWQTAQQAQPPVQPADNTGGTAQHPGRRSRNSRRRRRPRKSSAATE